MSWSLSFQVQSQSIWSTSSGKITGCVKAPRVDSWQSVLGIIFKEVPRIEVFFLFIKVGLRIFLIFLIIFNFITKSRKHFNQYFVLHIIQIVPFPPPHSEFNLPAPHMHNRGTATVHNNRPVTCKALPQLVD